MAQEDRKRATRVSPSAHGCQGRAAVSWEKLLQQVLRKLVDVGLAEELAERTKPVLLAHVLIAPVRYVLAAFPEALPPQLGRREMDVARLAREGLTNSQIASQLDMTLETVKSTLKHGFHKLRVRSRRDIPERLPGDREGPPRPEAEEGRASGARLPEIRNRAADLLRAIVLRGRSPPEGQRLLEGDPGPTELARVLVQFWWLTLQAVMEPMGGT
ncbi:MAG: hypothetical protein HY721_22500 [Planctomycetes bacterium]|nr:hypothetical protein [Planctomycetota bacterium]